MDASPAPTAFDVDVVNQDWKVRLVLWLVVAVLAYMVLQVLALFLTGHSFFAWWKKNDPEGLNKRSNCISQFLLMAYAQGSSGLLYTMVRLLVGKQKGDVTDVMLDFIIQQLFPLQRMAGPDGKQMGILTPTALCRTVRLEYGQGDELFDAWLTETNRKGEGGFTVSRVLDDPNAQMNAQPAHTWSTKKGNFQFFRLQKPSTATWALYPDPTNRYAWAALILCWINNITFEESADLSGDAIENDMTWVLMESVSPDTKSVWVFYPQRKDTKATIDAWFTPKDSKNYPHNFLGRYGINVQAPFIESMISNNWVKYKGDPVYFRNLVYGGWIAALKGAGGDSGQITRDDLVTKVFGITDTKGTVPPPGTVCNANGFQKFLSFLGGGIPGAAGIGIMAAMPDIWAGPAGWVVLAAAATVGVIEGTKAAIHRC